MQHDVRAVLSGAVPSYAAACVEHEQSATKVDLASPRSAASKANVEPQPVDTHRAAAPTSRDGNPFTRSQRAVAATVVMPGSNANVRPPVASGPNAAPAVTQDFALAPTVVPLTQDGAVPHLPNSTPHPPTPGLPVTMQGGQPTLPDPTVAESDVQRLPSSAVAVGAAPASLAALTKRRRRTLITGFLLVFVLLVVTTALAVAFLKTRRATSSTTSPSGPSPSGPSVALPLGSSRTSAEDGSSSASLVAPRVPTVGSASSVSGHPSERTDASEASSATDNVGPKSGFLPGSPSTASAAVPTPIPPTPAKPPSAATTHRNGKATRATSGKSATVKVSTRKKRSRAQ
jgi:hypothetical protein